MEHIPHESVLLVYFERTKPPKSMELKAAFTFLKVKHVASRKLSVCFGLSFTLYSFIAILVERKESYSFSNHKLKMLKLFIEIIKYDCIFKLISIQIKMRTLDAYFL